jgi:hypothetical protein
MNLTLFLYNFSKIYVPSVLILCLFYASFGQFSKAVKGYQPKSPDKMHHSQQSIPGQLIPPQIIQKKADPSQSRTIKQTDSVQPKYSYLVEFTSGKSMTVDDVKLENNLVHFIIQDGYNMTMSKREIKSIKKIKL